MSKQYWHCIIGPARANEIPFGGDSPLRMMVRTAFARTIGRHADHCYSGWGMSESEHHLTSVLHSGVFGITNTATHQRRWEQIAALKLRLCSEIDQLYATQQSKETGKEDTQ